jgi:hypothetical protein
VLTKTVLERALEVEMEDLSVPKIRITAPASQLFEGRGLTG